MKDRIPTKPGRMKLTPSADGDDLFVLERADAPSQEGTPLNKASLLSDATAALFGLSGDPTVNDALATVGNGFTMVRTGAAAPGLGTTAKRGDVYIEDSGTGARRAYLCDYVGTRALDPGATWEVGAIHQSDGHLLDGGSYDKYIRSDLVHIPAGTVVSIASGYAFRAVFYVDGFFSESWAFKTSAQTIENDADVRFVVRKDPVGYSAAVVETYAVAISFSATGAFWTPLAAVREVRKTAIFTEKSRCSASAEARAVKRRLPVLTATAEAAGAWRHGPEC